MADTIPLIVLEAGVWTDVYAATGITVGNALEVQVFNAQEDVLGTIAASEPSDDLSVVALRKDRTIYKITAGESGFWCKSNSGGRLSVQEG